MSALKINSSVTERFLRYVQIDTQSDPHSKTVPSTAKQKDLARLLVEELKSMGIADAELDPNGYVYATIPANGKADTPVICYCSHMDTSPDCSGKDVKPIIHKNYNGQDLVLPDDHSIIIKKEDHPDLAKQIGNDIITASGTTLLGADNKSGVAAIMDMAQYFMDSPEHKHGKIRILFTPDEEIGRGTNEVDLERLGADFGYTVDGESLGSMEDETFSADGVVIEIEGVSAHTGYAKGKMVNALKVAADFLAALPKDHLSPETTEGRAGFFHPLHIEGIAEKVKIEFLIRDFRTEALIEKENYLKKILDKTLEMYPNSKASFQVHEQYRNMKEVLDQHPQVVAFAEEAIKRAGLKLKKGSIRGGTDGSRLSFMGLPCPNIFAGEHAFHSKEEWVSVQDMQKSVETLIHLASIWEEKA
ncbi:MAG: peptidase T [Bacteroidia bacterium]|nr:peptidase T [Bacteroidia bacterium]